MTCIRVVRQAREVIAVCLCLFVYVLLVYIHTYTGKSCKGGRRKYCIPVSCPVTGIVCCCFGV